MMLFSVPRSDIVARLAVNGNAPRFGRVPELTMAAARRDLDPAIIGKHAENLTDLRRHSGLTPPVPWR